MGYEVRRSRACRNDLERIFDHLVAAHLELGADMAEAFDRAETRLSRIEDDMASLGRAPHRGTLWPEVMTGLRWVTIDRAIYYFLVDDDREAVHVLAVFFGGQDHKRHVLDRIRPR
ncbi:type II toxin-antitoxin system RelE/ParE family toxin [Mesobacterium pallidum]|uniref:type II toxin-antitoxin system RelE/ParE family toxin n=1 Tax=Mesobacterium pallidum TaxID=2872037 RepID=UPI001EE2B133|nr:type II toxin-antitoxin system RelE/ParE family toxin [Mesobacterium pallidum]